MARAGVCLCAMLLALAGTQGAAAATPVSVLEHARISDGGVKAGGADTQPLLYEISTRPFLYALAQSGVQANCGEYVCLGDVPESQWQQLKTDSVDIVWLMGVWELGEFGLKHDQAPSMMSGYRSVLPDVQTADVIGSPYSVVNYTANTVIGGPSALAGVRKVLSSMGMKLMVDFVPNHLAVDSWLATSMPAAFVQKPSSGSFPDNWWIQRGSTTFAFGRDPYDGAWTDVIQLNYWNPDTVSAMTATLLSIASQADAIRCDMAMLPLNDVFSRVWGGVMSAGGFNRPGQEFWSVAINAVREQHPGVILMGEAYNYGFTNPPEKQMLQNLGFDFVYDKTVLDDLKGNNLDTLRSYIGGQSQSFFEHTAHFVENHDEPRSAATLGGQQQAFAGSVVASTIPGLRLFYFGQFDGFSAKLDVHLRRATAQTPNSALHKQYTTLLAVLADPVFHSGSWTFISTPESGTAWRLCAWRWTSSDGSDKRLVVVNFSNTQAWGSIQVADAESRGGSDNITVTELLTNTPYQRSASTMRGAGLNVGVDPWRAQIFSY